MLFKIGQKVVCVYAGKFDLGSCGWFPGEEVHEGRTYTVVRSHHDDFGNPVVWLAEVKRADRSREMHGPNCGYGTSRFRPIVERKTDISIFTEILNGTRVPETTASLRDQ